MPERLARILLVEDDEAVRELCVELLDDAGYEVESAKDGLSALFMMRERLYDLVLTDINMPELDGIGLYLNAIKEFSYMKDRFLFMTGDVSAESEAIKVLTRLGKAYLQKPFKAGVLLDSVKTAIARRHAA